jgi:hypothetical protein
MPISTFVVAAPRPLLRTAPAGRSLVWPSRFSSSPVVMLYGAAD